MSSEVFPGTGIFMQPRFPSYGTNTFGTINIGLPTILSSKSKDSRVGDPFQMLYTTPFDIDDLKLTTNNKNNHRTSFPTEDNEPIVLGKFSEDNAQNDEEDLKILLSQIDQYAGNPSSLLIESNCLM